MAHEAGDFISLVVHEITIDLRSFLQDHLPGHTHEVKFRFVNPLWAWAQVANDMVDTGHVLHFLPKTMTHDVTGENMYGAGVEFGNALKIATSRTPCNSKPAFFGISFDGGDSGVSNRSIYPICVSVLNVNGADPAQCALVGFIPALDVPDSYKNTDQFRKTRAHVLQQCIGAVVDCIENVARVGFTARIGKDLSLYHPFLVAIRVDSKERKTYFGLKSDRCAYVYMHSYMDTHICKLVYGLSYMYTHIWTLIYVNPYMGSHICTLIYAHSYIVSSRVQDMRHLSVPQGLVIVAEGDFTR